MIRITDFVRALHLDILSPGATSEIDIQSSDINRPGLQLAGFWDYFAYQRPQLLGKVEMTYLHSMDEATRKERLEKFFSYDIPCVIVCHGMPCIDGLAQVASKRGIPVFSSGRDTTLVVLEVINYLNNQLAPRITCHGVLVDIFGSGLLITGESGVGKSEAALELVKRGHRLVADDVVDIRRVTETRLVGESPEMVRHFMEIRGVGIIDISVMYGIGSVIKSKSIDLVVHLETWSAEKDYDRLGLEENYTDILGVRLPQLVIPIRPGRNLAIVLEVAARNFRLKQSGFNAARELDKRLREKLARSTEE